MNQHTFIPKVSRSNVVPFRSAEPYLPGIEGDRYPPANIPAEQALLGALLLNNDVAPIVGRFLRPEHFYEGLHQRIYSVTCTLIAEGRPADAITLGSYLPADKDLGGVTLGQYLSRLRAEATTVINAEAYARTVHDLWVRREIVGLAASAIDAAYDAPVEDHPDVQIERIQQSVAKLQVALSDRERKAVNLKSAGAELIAAIQADLQGKAAPIPKTAITQLDKEMALLPSSLIVIPARTSMGKSIVGVEFIFSVACQGFGGVIHSLEMPRTQIMARLASSYLLEQGIRIPYSRMLRPGGLSIDEAEKVAGAIRDLESLPIIIEDKGGRTIFDIQAASRRHAAVFKRRGIHLGAVLIDHAHIVSPSRPFHNDVQQIKEVTTESLNLCKELECPVLLLAQCNRGSESREDKRPTLIDVRGGGSFEEDADVVLFPYRPAYHIQRSSAFRSEEDTPESIKARDEYERTKHVIQFFLDKNRAGRSGEMIEAWVDPAFNAVRSESPWKGGRND